MSPITDSLTDFQKKLLLEFLNIQDKTLHEQLAEIADLKNKIAQDVNGEPLNGQKKESENKTKVFTLLNELPPQTWRGRVYDAFGHFKRPLTSTEIIDWLIETDKDVAARPRDEIVGGITSRLSIMVDKGLLTKEKKEGEKKLRYMLKK